MSPIHPLALEHQRKRFTRADAYRFAPPGTPEAKPPGWLDPSATRVRWKEAQEEEARAAFDAQVAELRASHERVKRELAEINYELAWRRILRKFRPDQPRVPKGDPKGGQWTKEGGGDAGKDGRGNTADDRPIKLAQSDFGKLIADFKVPGGRRCVYNFGVFSVVVPGPVNFRCPSSAHWSGVVHGRLLNDN